MHEHRLLKFLQFARTNQRTTPKPLKLPATSTNQNFPKLLIDSYPMDCSQRLANLTRKVRENLTLTNCMRNFRMRCHKLQYEYFSVSYTEKALELPHFPHCVLLRDAWVLQKMRDMESCQNGAGIEILGRKRGAEICCSHPPHCVNCWGFIRIMYGRLQKCPIKKEKGYQSTHF
ncbi:hypothetical protein NPIL_384051 [Nephila pilipes]|uniref:Uncharacterized protein n=1 Tax=Nephila pilipes TaxID=299642 RepID=A0A8X6TP14_NEPPI|nr:hypothetical protein NPIL_384051 [Nephila pilipes]